MWLVEAGGLAEVDDSAVVIPRARRSHSRRTKVASPLDGQSQRLSKCPSEWITGSTDSTRIARAKYPGADAALTCPQPYPVPEVLRVPRWPCTAPSLPPPTTDS